MSDIISGSRAARAAALAAITCLLIVPAGRANPYGPPTRIDDPQSAGGQLGQSASLSLDGTVAVVGEPDSGGGTGSALVYVKAGGGWTLAQRLTPTGENGSGHFGSAVAVDPYGQTLIVGAPDDNGGIGAAWVFALAEGTWEQQGELLGGAGETGAGRFGASVALGSGGMVALVGAPMSDAGKGQAFTFYYEQAGGWYLFEHMKRLKVEANAHFGASVALAVNSEAALVGAPNAAAGAGAIYPYSYFGL
jgi:hypothetical protein